MFMLATLIVSCNQKKIDQLNADNLELASEKDSISNNLKSYLQTFNEIEKNLDEIKSREEKINLQTKDNIEFAENDSRKAVVNDIKAINTLMKENRQKMADLQSQLSSTSNEFKSMVARLNKRLNAKDEELVALKSDLESLNIEKIELAQSVDRLNYTVDTLSTKTQFQTSVIDAQYEKIEDQTEELNTRYVTVGTFKSLRDEKVVDKEGGILGIGSTETLRDDINQNAFQKIDATKTMAIHVGAKKAELVTSHPKGSYELSKNANEEIEQLTILNPTEFWKSSKYLVVMIN